MWSRQQYEDRIRDRLGDLGILQHLADTRIPLALEAALATLTKDRPARMAGTLSGDGTTRTFDLTALTGWVAGWSTVDTVEHPTGSNPRTYVDSHDWRTEDDTLELTYAPTAGTDNIRVRFDGAWPFPTDDPADDPLPEPLAIAAAALAAANVARGKAIEFARQQSSSVAGDLFQRDPAPLFEAARDLEKQYTDTVLGRPADQGTAAKVAMTTIDVDTFPASLLHRRAQYIGEEALGD